MTIFAVRIKERFLNISKDILDENIVENA